MRKLLLTTVKKTINWPHSRPFLIRIASGLGVHEIAKKIYVVLRPAIVTDAADLDPSYLASRELMEEVQAELTNPSSNHSVVFLKK